MMIRKAYYLPEKKFTWPLSKKLLFSILDDQVSDVFVCELIWERLFYIKEKPIENWICSEYTPSYWSEKYNNSPQIISERGASIHLTRSIPKDHKQNLKKVLDFKGYKINELTPRKTRRATAVNWLICWVIEYESMLKEYDKLPILSSPPFNPMHGHKGDPEIK
ncbi:conserved hypothetical protein [Prochlorococcus marinus str. MIT 9515]|uniref:DUF1823 domain-containing protein n=1 Tax=Prochlorococcus marinus (strain MIT 9515) TaxID=167542 RepID=A2BV50_PROM5|nr:conserved hypothetical protein [Prochlorococcus marinus str. MIT 9515]